MSKLLKILPEWIADEKLNVNENRCFKEKDPELSSTLHSHSMFSLTSTYAHSTLPNSIDVFQNFCTKLWLWSHRVQDFWLKSMPPQDVFFKAVGTPRSAGGGKHTQVLEDVPNLKPAVWSQNLQSLTSFKSENLESCQI